jgi:hypothetical protein
VRSQLHKRSECRGTFVRPSRTNITIAALLATLLIACSGPADRIYVDVPLREQAVWQEVVVVGHIYGLGTYAYELPAP